MTKKLSTPFATDSTLRNDVPVNATSDQKSKGIVGYNNGWTEINKLPLENGGQPPYMEDLNGILYDVTSNIVYTNKGLPQYFDPDYAQLIGGYPIGARLMLDNNTNYVSSIVSNNTNNPNSNMNGWSSLSSTHIVNTISDLRSYRPIDLSKYVTVQRYYDISDVRSGGNFYYDASDTTTPEDGVFVFTSNVLNGRWKRVLDNTTINITQGGLIGFGEESDKLNNLLKACENQSTVLNYSRKFTVEGLDFRIMCQKQINLNMTLVKMQNIDILSTLADQTSYNNTTGCALLIYGTDAWTNYSNSNYRRRHKEKLNSIEVINANSGANTLGIVLRPNVEGQFANSIFEQVNAIGFDYNLVLSSNCYLITFKQCSYSGSKKYNLTTTSYLGIESKMTNMGENIRFDKCTLADSVGGVMAVDFEMWLTMDSCSFDYNGKATDTTAWFELLGNTTLNLVNCHYEAGNQNSQLGKRLFHTTTALSSVKITGGTMLFGESCDNDYVFYSDDPLNHNFSVENVWVWGAGLAKKAWSNTGMGRFRIVPNSSAGMGDVKAPAVQAPNKSLTADYNFVKSNLLQKPVDQWFVSDGGDATRTSQISSSGVTGSYTTTTDENGNTVPCLKLVVNKTDQSVSLLIKRPKMRNAFNPAFRLRYKSNIEVPGNLFASVKPVDVSQEIDVSKNIFVPSINTSRWDTSVFGFNVEYKSNNDVKEMRYQSCSSRAFAGLETYDYYLFNLNFTLRAGFELYILSAECYDMDN